MSQIWHIYTDGGARGNPGPAACAFVVLADGVEAHVSARYLGTTTNNEAEYNGLIDSLEYVLATLPKTKTSRTIEWKLDSKLVVEQIGGRWKVKEPRLQTLCFRAQSLLASLPCCYTIQHVVRSLNTRADQLVNEKLDSV